jgi:hypothetical protein
MKELTISMKKMQVYALVGGTAIVALLVLPYTFLYGVDGLREVAHFFKFPIFIPSIVLGIAVHEAVHGLAWAWASGVGLDKIKYGFQVKTLTPYAHSTVPMSAKAYRIGAAMPLVVLGLLPYAVGLASKWPVVVGFGIFFSFAAVGDLMILWIVRGLDASQLVQDHPTKGGVILPDET